jgi:hypothetical protein
MTNENNMALPNDLPATLDNRSEAGLVDATSLVKTELEVATQNAHKYPRSIKLFRDKAMTLATINEDVAESCFYVLPRAGKTIEGPGIRLAEIVGSCWGNIRYGARVVGQTDEYITAQGVATDLENNVSMSIEVSRRIRTREGKKYNDDGIVNAGNAACAIALRNAIFKVVPKVFVDEIYQQAKVVAVGKASTIQQRKDKAFMAFAKMGVSKEKVLSVLGKKGDNEIDLADIEKLIGMHTAIKEGTSTVDEIFNLVPDADELKPKKKSEAKTIEVVFEQPDVQPETIVQETQKSGSTPNAGVEKKTAEPAVDPATIPMTKDTDSALMGVIISKKIVKTKIDQIVKERYGLDSRSKLTEAEAIDLIAFLKESK